MNLSYLPTVVLMPALYLSIFHGFTAPLGTLCLCRFLAACLSRKEIALHSKEELGRKALTWNSVELDVGN